MRRYEKQKKMERIKNVLETEFCVNNITILTKNKLLQIILSKSHVLSLE